MEKEKKEKRPRPKKIIRVILAIFQIIFVAVTIFTIYSIFLINGIESQIRYLAMAAILLLNAVILIFLRKLLKKNNLSRFISFIVIISVLIAIYGTVGYFIYTTYAKIDSVNKDRVTYETAVITLNDSGIDSIDDLNGKTIGINADETSIDGYIIGLEIINEHKLNTDATVVEYNSFSELVGDLYDGTIDAAILPKTYPTMFTSIEEYKNIGTETKIIATKEKTLTKEEIAKYTGEEMVNINQSNQITEPFTVLLMGIDSTEETLSKNATGNGDALMLVTFNPKTLNATILSIPRDSYVPIACFTNQKENKITHAAWNGESCMIKTIENFTGINIDYYVKVNFKGVVKMVDTLGGIEVDVPMDFCEQDSDRRFGSHLICLEEGLQTLNGEEALALARHRKTLATGDLQRGLNQQLVVQGMLNKLKSISSANQALEILDTVSNSIDTNFTTNQLLSFYDIAKNILLTSNSENIINIQQLYLSGVSQNIYDESMGLVLSDYIINQSSLDQVVKVMKQNLGLEDVSLTYQMDFDIEDEYEMETIGKNPTSSTETYALLPNFVGEDISHARAWLGARGISVKIEEKVVTSATDGQILSQNLPENKRLDLIGSAGVTFTVAVVEQATVTPPTETPEEPETPETPETPEIPGTPSDGDNQDSSTDAVEDNDTTTSTEPSL